MIYVEFTALCSYFEQLEKTAKRLELIAIIQELLSQTPTEELEPVIYMVLGQLGPKYDEPNLGIAERMAIEALRNAAGVSSKKANEVLNQVGDLGEAARILLSKERSSSLEMFLGGDSSVYSAKLSVRQVWNRLLDIALLTGEGSAKMKIRSLTKLLVDLDPIGAKYVMRLVMGKMRLGVADMTVVEAIARAYLGDKELKPIVEQAYFKRSDLAEIAIMAKEQGVEALKSVRVEPGRPVQCMAAQRLSDPEEILEKLGGSCQVEYKYDGLRFQYHLDKNGHARLWSRRQEDLTPMFPDVINALKNALGNAPIIVEGEIVAYDYEKDRIIEFQTLMQRRRKYGIEAKLEEIPSKSFLFDILYVDGKDVTSLSLPKRRELLARHCSCSKKTELSTSEIVSNVDDFNEFFDQAIDANCEGIMAKDISTKSVYEAGARGWLWIKYKADYRSELADTFDLVVVGAWFGRGRRGGYYGTLLMAAYDPESDTFPTFCKLGSGLNDEDLEYLKTELEKLRVPDKPKNVSSELEPDIWVEPKLVMEIVATEITQSPIHMVTDEDGNRLALRFPRFTGRYRDDKDPYDITTVQEIRELKKLRIQNRD